MKQLIQKIVQRFKKQEVVTESPTELNQESVTEAVTESEQVKKEELVTETSPAESKSSLAELEVLPTTESERVAEEESTTESLSEESESATLQTESEIESVPAGQLPYALNDEKLRMRAFTHASFGADNNEKLEWLGDAILDFLVSDILYAMYPNMKEGVLTQARSRLVSGKSLAMIARDIGLPSLLRLSQGEERNGGRERDTILAGAMEAYIAAVYLDGGLTAAQKVARILFDASAQKIGDVSADMLKDSKTRLQEFLQKRGYPAPQYTVLSRSMAMSRPLCVVECKVGEMMMLAVADNQRDAEQAASGCVLATLANTK